jgi:hypothetical protein
LLGRSLGSKLLGLSAELLGRVWGQEVGGVGRGHEVGGAECGRKIAGVELGEVKLLGQSVG